MTFITNNRLFMEQYGNTKAVHFVDGGIKDVLVKVRDMVHQGYVLETHPLSGSVKPVETPVKSVALSLPIHASGVHMPSLAMAEGAVAACAKFAESAYAGQPGFQEDVMRIDLSLMESFLDSLT